MTGISLLVPPVGRIWKRKATDKKGMKRKSICFLTQESSTWPSYEKNLESQKQSTPQCENSTRPERQVSREDWPSRPLLSKPSRNSSKTINLSEGQYELHSINCHHLLKALLTKATAKPFDIRYDDTCQSSNAVKLMPLIIPKDDTKNAVSGIDMPVTQLRD